MEVANRWQQLSAFATLRMERALGASVRVVRSRKEAADPALRMQAIVAGLAKDGRLSNTFASVAPTFGL